MNLKILLCLTSILFPGILMAKGDITGKVINESTKEPMDFVTIQLFDKKGKPLAIGTSTDIEGSFTLRNINNGDYIVKISNIGSLDQEIPVTISDHNIDLKDIFLADDSKMLQEVVVEGIRSQMRFELDRKIFSVDASVMAAGTSASELLESIPSIEVDQDGEVSLRGDSSVTIWINGKESGLTADNRAQILEQIPAETIDRIEVITNPSSKYSPEGTAGIINIILKKDRRAGYFGSAEISGNSRGGGNSGVNINYNSSKVDAFAGLGFRMRRNTGGSIMNRSYHTNYEFAPGEFYDNDYFTRGESKSPNRGNNIFFRLGATWHISDFDDLSASGFGMLGHNRSSSVTNYISNLPLNWIRNINKSNNKNDMHGMHAELGYTHKWNDTNILDINGSFNLWGGKQWHSYEQDMFYDEEELNQLLYQEQNMDMNTKGGELKIDYSNQLKQWLKLETGYKGNISKENTPTDTYTGTNPSDMTQNPLLYNRFIYKNLINALYLTLGGTINRFSFSAGVRGEQWSIRTRSLAFDQKENEVPEFKKNNFALFPSLFLSLSLPYDNEMQVNYTRRLRRPWGGQLNSFRNISDPTNISYGNPELQPQYSNSFELNYLKSWTWHMISLSAYMRTTSDMTNRISYLEGDVMYSTWANVADQTNAGCEIVVKNNFFNCLDLTTTLNLYNNHISAWTYDFLTETGNVIRLTGDKHDSFAWSLRAIAGVKLPWSLSIQATGNYNSKSLTAQGSRQGGWSIDLGLRKNLGNWSVALNCRDLFDSRRFRSITDGPGYSQYNERWRGGRTLRLTVKFSFGNMSGKKDNNRMDNDIDEGGGFGDMSI